MSNPFTNTQWSRVPKWKLFFIAGGVLVGLVIILSVIKTLLLGNSYSTGGVSFSNSLNDKGMGMVQEMAYAPAPSYSVDSMMEDVSTPTRLASNSVGGDAESYEALSYNVTYKDKAIENTCNTIESWKPLQYVVFEYATRNDTSCNYRFKVERAYVDGILEAVEVLDPDYFTANTATMKKQVVQYEGQLTILLRKQDILEETLSGAVYSYNELTALATDVKDVESLTKIIESKLTTISRLTNERGNLANQIESLARRSAEVEDQIQYVSFSVQVDKYKLLDFTAMKDSWVYKTRVFIQNANTTLQDLTLGVLGLLLQLLQVIVYIGVVLLVVLVVLKFGVQSTKRFWKGDTPQE